MNCLIYPFTTECIAFAEYVQEFRNDLNIVKAVCLPIFRTRFDNIGSIDVGTDFETSLKDVECVIICDFNHINALYNNVIDKIIIAIESGKKVICYAELYNDELKKIRSITKNDNDAFVYLGNEPEIMISDILYEKQECVVIGVGKLMSGIDTDKCFCNLYSRFKKMGYNVVGISNRNSQLIGCSLFPDEIYTSYATDDQKVTFINDYINKIQTKYCADIILIQFPYGMVKFTDEVGDGYAIRSYILSQALSVDYFVLNMPVDAIDPGSFDELNNQFIYKFDFSIDAVLFVNSALNVIDSLEHFKIQYQDVSEEYTEKICCSFDELNEDVFFGVSERNDDYDKIVTMCVENLSENIEEL